MNKSESINELSAALSKCQSEIKGAAKDSKNPFFKSNYADLSSVWESCRLPLSKNGLSVIQCPEEGDKGIVIETMLCHSSGQWVSSRYTIPVSKADAQAVGSAITYGRRYALASMVGVAPEDDDGNSAAKSAPKTEDIKTISSDQAVLLADMIKETNSDLSGFLKFCGGSTSIEKIPEKFYEKAFNALKNKLDKEDEGIKQ